MELEDDGFDFSVLSEFRDRLIEGRREKQILDKMLSRFGELGLLKSRGKARTDSTHILAAVKELTRLEHMENFGLYDRELYLFEGLCKEPHLLLYTESGNLKVSKRKK